jgi:glycosyltransferase involved in cell wall biosynthesis
MEGMSMPVIVNCRFLTQPVTGVQRFAEEITKRLSEELPDVVLVAPDEDLRHESLGGLPVQRVGKLHGHLWEQIELPRFVRRHHGFLVSLANTAPVLQREQFIVIHDITWARVPQSYSTGFKLWYRFMTKRLIRKARLLGTVSEFSRHDLANYWGIDPEQITVIPNAVDEGFLELPGSKPQGAPDGRFLLTVASLAPHKNVRALIDAYKRAAADADLPPLVLVGGSSKVFAADFSTLPSAGSSEGAEIIALGRVSDEELVWLYKHARAFVFPSLYEGFGIPPLEALAFGCPVLSSDAASMPEVLGAAASYFDPNNQESMVDALVSTVDLASAPVRSRRLERYSWQKSAKLIADKVKHEIRQNG